MTAAPIPLVDLQVQHRQIADRVAAGFDAVMREGSFILGKEVSAFEGEYAAFESVDHCVGVGNGTDALEIMLRAAGIGAGCDVIVPANTFAATALAAIRTGAAVIFADVDPDTLLLTPESADAVRTPATRAVIAVHLYGQFAPIEALATWAEQHDLMLFEDAAQSHGATRNDQSAGRHSVAAATSFYPGKNLGAYGDGGAVLTNSEAIASEVRALRNYGGEAKYVHDSLGFNSRLDSLQAVVLRAKLERLAEWNEQRRAAAAYYLDALRDIEELRLPVVDAGNIHVWHLFVIRVRERDAVLGQLHERGIGAGIHYPHPLHRVGAFARPELPCLPGAEAAAKEVLSLPIYPGITEEQQSRVVAALLAALG